MKLKQRDLLYELLKGYPKYINEIEMNGVDNLKPESIEKILDILLTVFTNYGLDDDEPNKYGLEIEDLIDIVNDAE